MVRIGDFSVELVEAESKHKFQEHQDANGEYYAEVEPESEYFIRLQSHYNDLVAAEITVDGQGINFGYWIAPNEKKDIGLEWVSDNKEIKSTFKFDKVPQRDADSNDDDTTLSAPMWTGKVVVEWYKAIRSYRYANNEEKNESSQEGWSDDESEDDESLQRWNGGNVEFVHGISNLDKIKGVKSCIGTVTEEQQVVKKKRRRAEQPREQQVHYETGRLVETVVLRYCSVLGLIRAKILPKPPLWEYHRLKSPALPIVGDSDPNMISPEPKHVQKRLKVGNVEQEVTVEEFDLT